MRPMKHSTTGSNDPFGARLDQIINMKHELVLLAGKIDWDWIDGEIAPQRERPGIETHFMIGLLLFTPPGSWWPVRAAHTEPYDGHTLRDVGDRTETLTGRPSDRAGSSPARSAASSVSSGASCRRSAVEPIIGHRKTRWSPQPLLTSKASQVIPATSSSQPSAATFAASWLRDPQP
jgi:hypothetical protein